MSATHLASYLGSAIKQLEDQEQQETQSVSDARALLAAAEKREAEVKELLRLVASFAKSLCTHVRCADVGKRPSWEELQLRGADEEEDVQEAVEDTIPSSDGWIKELYHDYATYTIATPDYQAYTGTVLRGGRGMQASGDGCYILRLSAAGEQVGQSPNPIYHIKNPQAFARPAFVKASGLRVIDGKLESINRSAAGVETICSIDWNDKKWHEGRGQVV